MLSARLLDISNWVAVKRPGVPVASCGVGVVAEFLLSLEVDDTRQSCTALRILIWGPRSSVSTVWYLSICGRWTRD